jgi:hypothetical protein
MPYKCERSDAHTTTPVEAGTLTGLGTGPLRSSPETYVRNRVVLFCGLVAERQYNPPSSSSASAPADGGLGPRSLRGAGFVTVGGWVEPAIFKEG